MDDDSNLFFYETFKQFSLKSEGLVDGREITQFFCSQAIPFLSEHPLLVPLRKKWSEQCQELSFDIQTAEKEAYKEVVVAFDKIKRALPSDLSDPKIKSIIQKISGIIVGQERYCSPPLYRVLFDEVAQLLQSLLDLGYVDLCSRFATVGVNKGVLVPKYLSAEDRWGILDSKGKFKLLHGKALELAQKRKDFRLFSIGPEMVKVDRYFITACAFAPSLNKTFLAHQSGSHENIHEPAIVWWYFESALFLWKLPEDYFNQPTPRLKTKQACKHHFETLGIIRSWREIAWAKYPYVEPVRCNVFTPQFFKNGLKTLHAAIVAYFASQPTISRESDELIFKLAFETTGHTRLKSHHLWLLLKIGNAEPTPYYLKRFNDGSPYFESVSDLLERHTSGGKIQIELKEDSDSIAKWIDRLGLGKVKKIFFGKPQKNEVFFKGKEVRVSKKTIPNFHVLLKGLQTHQQKARAPVFSGSQDS